MRHNEDMNATTTYETHDIDICVDCLMMLANGTIGGDATPAMDDLHLSLMELQWPSADGWHVSLNCDENCEGGFSWSQCEGCGENLGGDRHPAVAMRKEA